MQLLLLWIPSIPSGTPSWALMTPKRFSPYCRHLERMPCQRFSLSPPPLSKSQSKNQNDLWSKHKNLFDLQHLDLSEKEAAAGTYHSPKDKRQLLSFLLGSSTNTGHRSPACSSSTAEEGNGSDGHANEEQYHGLRISVQFAQALTGPRHHILIHVSSWWRCTHVLAFHDGHHAHGHDGDGALPRHALWHALWRWWNDGAWHGGTVDSSVSCFPFHSHHSTLSLCPASGPHRRLCTRHARDGAYGLHCWILSKHICHALLVGPSSLELWQHLSTSSRDVRRREQQRQFLTLKKVEKVPCQVRFLS